MAGGGTSGVDTELSARVETLVQPIAGEVGVDLLDVEVKGPRNRRIVRLVADAEGGLDVDLIAEVSRKVSDALDDEDVVPGTYTLEVTSPGVDRPLSTARDFRRNLGRDVKILLQADTHSELNGTVTGVTDDTVTLEVDGDQRHVPLDGVKTAKIILPW